MNDKLIGFAAIMVIIITFGWCIQLLLRAPIVGYIKTGSKTIRSGGISTDEGKSLLNQKY